MTALSLPALDGRSPLGFLAALGVLRLVTDRERGREAQLSWSREDCTAVLSSAFDTVDELVEDLEAIVSGIPAQGVLPDLPVHLPPPGEAPDRMRLPRPEFRALAKRVWTDGKAEGERWMASLVTDLSVDDKKRADISLMAAPSGKQSMRTMLDKPLDLVRKRPQVLTEALLGWRRNPGVSGEYLDHRVLFDAVDAVDGKSQERGVPGATWLALMSYPLLRTTASRGEPLTTTWQATGRRAGARRMVYPLWSQPLDVHAVSALLHHPELSGVAPGPVGDRIALLSVFLVCAAERRRIPGRTFAGVLVPTTSRVDRDRGRSRRRAGR